jgi:hypothetical protein
MQAGVRRRRQPAAPALRWQKDVAVPTMNISQKVPGITQKNSGRDEPSLSNPESILAPNKEI